MSYKIIGHRGNKSEYTENTIAGFQSILDTEGIDGFECDVVVSQDKKLVISHDYYIEDKNQNKQMLYDLTYDEILQIEKGKIVNTPKNTFKYPLLEDLLLICSQSNKTKKILIEIKSIPSTSLPLSIKKIISQVHSLLKTYNLVHSVYIISFDSRIIEESRKQNKDIKTGFICHRNLFPLSCIINTLQPSLIIIEKDWITKQQVKEITKKDIELFIWTANTKEDWLRLIDSGVNGIITDLPNELKYHKLHNP